MTAPLAQPLLLGIVSTETILPVRTQVLRPHFEAGQFAEFEGDDAPDTFHVAAINGSKVIGVATFMRRASPNGVEGYQLRGMAVLPQCQSQGVGGRIIDMAFTELALRGCVHLWCNARESARRFYEAAGFQVVSDRFEIAGIGPHFVMARRVPGAIT